MGERTPLALLDAPASGRMAVGEAITNLAAARHRATVGDVKLSANWMAPPATPARTPRCSTRCARSAMELCPALGIAIPVGKDSLSMRTTWRDGGAEQGGDRAAVADRLRLRAGRRRARRRCTPQLRARRGRDRAAADRPRRAAGTAWAARRWRRSTASSATTPPDLDDPARARGLLRRDPGAARATACCSPTTTVADGGLFATLGEMAFAARCGLDVVLAGGADAAAPRCSPRSWAPSSRCARATSRPRATRARAPPASRLHARRRARRRTTASASRRTARASSTSRASTCTAPGRRRRTRCSACATTRPAPTRSTTRMLDADDPGLRAALDLRPRRRRRRAVHRDAARGRASRSCASRASTARSRWPPPSTAPASTPSTCT